jgi:hypothetical protein
MVVNRGQNSLFLLNFSIAIYVRDAGVVPLISVTGQADRRPAATKRPFPKDGRSAFEVVGAVCSGFSKEFGELPRKPVASLTRKTPHCIGRAAAMRAATLPRQREPGIVRGRRCKAIVSIKRSSMTAEGGWNAKCASSNSIVSRSAMS